VNPILTTEDEARAWFEQSFHPTEKQWKRLEYFAQLLRAENDKQNLIAASTVENLWVRHLADSAQLLTVMPAKVGPWIDLGSGPGLPGLVLAILIADVSMSLDNVLAVAGAAKDHPGIMIVGLAFAVALMGIAANYLARLIERYRWIGLLGLALVLYVAVKMMYEGWVDPVVGVGTLFQ